MAAATWGSSLLGLVPSELNKGKAIRALLESAKEPSILLSSGLGRVRHALHLMQMEAVIKRLVISLVLDKAFWSAILNNQSVKKFLELLLSVSASHCKPSPPPPPPPPPPCSASGCASPGKMAAATWGSSLLGLAPSELNIRKAIRALLDSAKEPSILLSSGLGKVRHALHLMQMEAVIKRLVISLVLDKAFWSAILNNQLVKKFLELLLSDKTESPQICEEVDWGTNDLQRTLDILKDKTVELIEKFKLLLIKTLQPSQQPTPEATVDGSS